MKKQIIYIGLIAFAILSSYYSCIKPNDIVKLTPKLPEVVYNYTDTVVVPSGNPWGSGVSENMPTNNITTDHGATLGRVLFYDKLLSINNSISCGSCHQQRLAFADNMAFSNGFKDMVTTRNSMPVFNMSTQSSFFWDSRATTLESQALLPVKNHIEMGLENMDQLEKKLAAIDYYKPLFKNAFGSEEVSKNKIAAALAQFMRSIKSFNSKFDDGKISNFSNLNELEREGMELFSNKTCASCHGGENFNGNQFSGGFPDPIFASSNMINIGLDINYSDKGWQDVTGISNDEGKFKVPTLRNIALTAPYMHDGRFKTLKEVVSHYNSNIQPHQNLDPRLTNSGWNGGGDNAPLKLNMTDKQVDALVAFLNTLNDNKLINDVRFSDPFKQ